MTNKKKILITDDDEELQHLLRLIFEKAGYDVALYGEAVPIFQNKYRSPDIFLLDKQLGRQDGLELCTFLKHQPSTKNIPVIMISATPGIGELAQEAGADDFLAKPFLKEELLRKVEKWV